MNPQKYDRCKQRRKNACCENLSLSTIPNVRHRIMEAMKVETAIIISIPSSPIGRVVILVIMYVETLEHDVVIFICSMCLMSHLL